MKKIFILLVFVLVNICQTTLSQEIQVCYDQPLLLNETFEAVTKQEFERWTEVYVTDGNDNKLFTVLKIDAGHAMLQWTKYNILTNLLNLDMTALQNKNLSLSLSQIAGVSGGSVPLTDNRVYKIVSIGGSALHDWFRTSTLVRTFKKPNPGLIGDDQSYVCKGYSYDVKSLLPVTGYTGNEPHITWQYSDGTPIYNQTDPTMTLNNITFPVSVRRVVTVDNCPTTFYSNTITINPYEEFKGGTIGYSQTVCYGAVPNTLSSAITPSGGSGSYNYKWYFNDGGSYEQIRSANQSFYTPLALIKTTFYKREVIDLLCGNKESNEITITVNDPITEGSITAVPDIPYNTVPDILICSNPTGGTGSYTYHWQQLTGGVFVNITDPQLNVTSQNFQPPALTVSTTYRRSVTSGSCGTAYTAPITITVYRAFDPGVIGSDMLGNGTIGGNQLVCSGKQPVQLIGTNPTGCVEGQYNYQWQSSNTPDESSFIDITGSQNSSYIPPVSATVKYYRRKVTSGACNPEYTNIIKVDVYAP
jgi:hypothetical protein